MEKITLNVDGIKCGLFEDICAFSLKFSRLYDHTAPVNSGAAYCTECGKIIGVEVVNGQLIGVELKEEPEPILQDSRF